jgi:hypothetical protein
MTLDLCAETHVGLHAKCLLLLSHLTKARTMYARFTKTPQYQIS